MAWTRARWPGHPLVLWGESLGSAVATRLAAEQGGIAGLILDSPLTSVADRAAELYPILPVRTLLRHDFPVLELIGRVDAPVLVIHGEADRVIPPDHGRRVLAAARQGEGLFLRDVGHPAIYDPNAGPAWHAVLRVLDRAATATPPLPATSTTAR
jgi:fermentation-respiration switch protein FrsA (DUF1100 family)